jgi:DNA-binding transcriptional LysR family regulator
MDLNLFSLRVFLTVADCKSFTTAAEALFLSQPAVSLQVQKIEQLFQTPLFIRNPSGSIQLTTAGETLQKHARKFVLLQQETLTEMGIHNPSLQQKLKIGACCISGEHLMPTGLSAFQESHPNISLSLSIIKCEHVFSGLLSGDFDIGVTGLAPRNRSLHKKKLFRAPLVLFHAGAIKPADGKITNLKRLLKARLILREKDSGCRVEFEKFLTKHKIHLNEFSIINESDSNEAIKNLVKEGYGISILPEFMLRKDIDDGVFSEIHLQEGQPSMAFYISYRNQNNPSKIIQELTTTLLKSLP